MGPVDEKLDHEFDEEILHSTLKTDRKGVLALDFESSPSMPLSREVPSLRLINTLQISPLSSIYTVLIKAKINVLLPFGPLAILLHYLTQKHELTFFFSLLGITPLAERLGSATEQLAFYTGPTVGGLLNATFGNATEMIISLYALKFGMIRVPNLARSCQLNKSPCLLCTIARACGSGWRLVPVLREEMHLFIPFSPQSL